MIVVALFALVLGLEMARRRWAIYQSLARYHADYEAGGLWSGRQCLENVVEYDQRRRQFVDQGDLRNAQICIDNSAPFAIEAKHQFELAEYHAQMKRYYERLW
jgi:hypothetical protein